MLRLVKNNERVTRAPMNRKGFREGLKRIAGLTAGERSLPELEALLEIFEWSVVALKREIRLKKKQSPQVRLVE